MTILHFASMEYMIYYAQELATRRNVVNAVHDELSKRAIMFFLKHCGVFLEGSPRCQIARCLRSSKQRQKVSE